MTEKPDISVVPPAVAPEGGVHTVHSLTEILEERRGERVKCRHQHMLVDVENRKVECKDCGRDVEPMEGMIILADRASRWQMTFDHMLKRHNDLAEWVPHMRAVRDLESLWAGKRLPKCPHCKEGIEAEALAKMDWVHQSFAKGVRAHKQETAPGAIPIKLGKPPT